MSEQHTPKPVHRVRGVDHAAFPTFDPNATVRFYRDVLHDPNGYLLEITRALRPVTPQEDLDAQLTIEALCAVTAGQAPSMDKLLTRKAELIVERAAGWERSHPGWRDAEKEMV